jgi:branched-chain amino acid transport system permease protein
MNMSARTPAIAAAGAVLLLCLFPLFGGQFWVSTAGPRMLILGTMALSLTFLTSTAGLVSLAQAAVAGVAGYTLALLSPNTSGMGTALPWPVAVLAAISAGCAFGALVGWISARSSGIYLIMITLAISVSAFYFFSQNTDIFNGFDGINGVKAPVVADVNLKGSPAFYFLCVGTAVVCAALVMAVNRTAFGLHLHAMRNSPRRLTALGFDCVLLRVAAFAFAGVIAGAGGILATWFSGQVSPGSVDVSAAVNLLVIAVLGGIGHPLGAFAGAVVFVLLENFAIEVISRERFNLVIGVVFMLVVLFGKGGLVGFIKPLAGLIQRGPRVVPRNRRQET